MIPAHRRRKDPLRRAVLAPKIRPWCMGCGKRHDPPLHDEVDLATFIEDGQEVDRSAGGDGP